MAPRNTARASTRSPSTRNQRASPLKRPNDRQPYSSIGLRTRMTRSQSRDLGDSDTEIPASTGVKRNRRQASVESEESVDNGVSNYSRPSSSRRGKNAALETSPDLSIVNEVAESELDYEDVEEDDDEVDIELAAQLLQSPGGVSQASQMSGTTAITSASVMTTHSAEVIHNLDPLLIELLPDLLTSACKIIDLLAPPKASTEVVESIVRELKMLTSRRAKRLKHDEEKFETDRKHFGEDHYINPTFIQRALFDRPDLDISNFRPDPILHAANLASLVKELFVTPKEGQGTPDILHRIDTWFPEAFLNKFDTITLSGNSRLQDESFDLGLEIRTQAAITSLFAHRESEGWDLEEIFLGLFFFVPPARQISPQISYFDDVLENGGVKDIMRAGPKNSDDQDEKIKSRVKEIRVAFQQTDDGDSVDFEILDEMFPWIGFLTKLARWCRLRMDEITARFGEEGKGVDYIVQSLIEAVEGNDSQVELYFETATPIVNPPQPDPSRTVTRSIAGQNLYDTQAVLTLEKLKQAMSLTDKPLLQSSPPSNADNLPSSSANRRSPSMTGAIEPSEASEAIHDGGVGDFLPTIDDDNEPPRSSRDVVVLWDRSNHYKNKENMPLPHELPPSTGNQSKVEGQKHARYDPDYTSVSSSSKRARHDDTEDTQDDGFEDDIRIPNPNRRKTAPASQDRFSVERVQSPPQMIRSIPGDERVAQSKRRGREQFEAAFRASVDEAEEDREQDRMSDVPPPTFQEVNAHAKYAVARSSQPTYRTTQKRVPWSEADTELLIELVAVHSTRWSAINEVGSFEVQRGQVALKDKARNIKVMYLKAGIPLPFNFEQVPLSAGQIELIKRVNPKWEE